MLECDSKRSRDARALACGSMLYRRAALGGRLAGRRACGASGTREEALFHGPARHPFDGQTFLCEARALISPPSFHVKPGPRPRGEHVSRECGSRVGLVTTIVASEATDGN